MSWPQKIIFLGFAGLFFLVPLIFLPFTSELFEFNKIILSAILTLVILFGWGARCILEKRLIFKRTYLDLPILIFLIIQLLSTFLSIDPQTSLLGYYGRWNGGLLSMIMYSLLYWAFVSNMDQKQTKNLIVYSLLPSAFLISIYGILQHFGIDDHLWVQDVKNRVFSTLGQPNWLAAYLVGLIFIPISLALNQNNKTKLTLLYSSTLLLFACLLFTKSRSGLLAFAISSIVFGVLTIRYEINVFMNRLFLVTCFLMLGLVLITSNPVRDLIYKPLAPAPKVAPTTALETGGTESGIIRQIVWRGAIGVWLDNPKSILLGSGPETFAHSYYLHRPLEHNNTSEWELLYNKAHNEFLNFLATTGLLGFSSYLLLLFSMLLVFLKTFKLNNSLEFGSWNLGINIALLSGWLSIHVTNFWGFSVVVTQLVLFLLPAMVVALSSIETEKSAKKSLTLVSASALGLLILLCAFGVYTVSKYFLADFYYASSQKAENAFLQTEETEHIINGYESAKTAYDLNPNEPVINLQLSTMAAYLSLIAMQVDATASAQFSQLSQDSSLRAVELSPNSPSIRKSRARNMILLSTVDPIHLESAAASLKSAQKLSPTDPRIPYNLGLVSQFMQATDSAKTYYQEAFNLKPDFADALEKLTELEPDSDKIKESKGN